MQPATWTESYRDLGMNSSIKNLRRAFSSSLRVTAREDGPSRGSWPESRQSSGTTLRRRICWSGLSKQLHSSSAALYSSAAAAGIPTLHWHAANNDIIRGAGVSVETLKKIEEEKKEDCEAMGLWTSQWRHNCSEWGGELVETWWPGKPKSVNLRVTYAWAKHKITRKTYE
jgi:hypothetical protein